MNKTSIATLPAAQFAEKCAEVLVWLNHRSLKREEYGYGSNGLYGLFADAHACLTRLLAENERMRATLVKARPYVRGIKGFSREHTIEALGLRSEIDAALGEKP